MMISGKFVTYAVTGALAATASMEALPMWEIAFDLDALIVAFYGALGGSARWLFLKEKWRDGLRLAVLGAILAAGVGNLWRVVIKAWIGDVPDSIVGQPETAYSGAFLIGLLAVTIMGRFIDADKEGSG